MRTVIPRTTLCLALIALASACLEEPLGDDPAVTSARTDDASPPGLDDGLDGLGLDDLVLAVAPDGDAALDPTCALPGERGPCAAFIPRWRYDTALGACRLFVYGGCGGNANNFTTRDACEARCEEPEPTCEQAPSYGACGGLQIRWFFDGSTGGCRRFIYSGCGGNANNFSSRAACEAGCPLDDCELPASHGPCSAFIPRWYFDDEAGECRRFVYGGCGGNDNNFPTLAACEGRCERDPCATCSPDATCQGAGGAAQCVCDPGFTGDGETCTAVDACATLNGGCSQFATCTSTGPGTRTCTCASGFAGDGTTCTPIDLCTMSNGGCSPFATCTPTGPGTRTCTCAGGTVGDGVTCAPPPPPPCECPPPGNEPVCGVDGQTYGSACLATCAGVPIAAPGECGFTLPDCSLPMTPGACNEQLDRWYWDAQLQQCKPFVYSGCGGNSNNFTSEAGCALACTPIGPCLPGAPGCQQQ